MAVATILKVIIISLCLSRSASLATKCRLVHQVHLMDCAEKHLQEVPAFNKNLEVFALTLKGNDIKFINFSRLVLELPNIKFVVVTGNPLDCLDVCNVDFINVLSDCNCTIPTLSSSAPPTHYSTTSSRHPFSSSSTVQALTSITYTTSATPNSPISSQSLYIVIIVPALLFVLLILLLVSLFRKYRNHRHRIHCQELEMTELFIVSEEDEIVISVGLKHFYFRIVTRKGTITIC